MSYPKKTTQNFTPLNTILNQQIKKMTNGKLNHTVNLEKLWQKIVGEPISNHAKILYCKNQILHVKVSNSTWLTELNFLKASLKKHLNKFLNDKPLQDIRFKILD